jgi:4-amino-4-deoxy-L-arabinose transferase-like glycosyltransferase
MQILAFLLAALAIVVPPGGLARLMVGSDSVGLDAVVVGVWFWKGLLLFHALLLWAWARARHTEPDAAPPVAPAGPDAVAAKSDWLRSPTVWLGLLLLAGLLLRLVRLEDGLWFDEIKTLVRYVSLSVGEITTTFDDQNQHVLYSVLARVSTDVLGVTRSALRLPAVLLGVASLWGVYHFGREVTSRGEALLATGLLTFSYHHVWFSQNARGYTGLLLWSLLASALFLRLLRNDRPNRYSLALAYGASVALATYTHMTAVVLFGAHLLIAAWALWRRPGDMDGLAPAPRPIVWGLVLGATLSAQLYAFVLPQMTETLLTPSIEGVSIAWKNPAWLIRETLTGLSRGLPGGWIALVVGSAITLAGLASYWKKHPRAVWVMILPAAITASVILALGHNLWPRFFFFSAGFGAIIVIRGLFVSTRLVLRRRTNAVGFAVAALLILGSATTVPGAWGDKQDFVGAARYVDEHRSDSDAVVMLDMCILPYDEYWERDWLIVPDVRELERVELGHERTWLVYSFPASLQTLQPDVWDRMQTHYRAAASFPGTVNGGEIVVMVNE